LEPGGFAVSIAWRKTPRTGNTMDNRFGFKDLILMVLLVVLIAMVGLAMVQYDRQWQVMQDSRKAQSEQTRELIAIRNLLERGNFAAGSGSSRPSDLNPPIRKTPSTPSNRPGSSPTSPAATG
jgi:hypothetical protein